MHPTLFRIGPLEVHSYGTLLMLGFVAGVLLSRRQARRVGLSPDLALDFGLWALVAGVAIARLTYAALNWHDFNQRPAEVLYIWREGGLSFHGGMLGGTVAALVFARRRHVSFWALADMATPGLALGYGFARLGCFLNGCCYGAPTGLPWAVRFPLWPDSHVTTEPCHPTQLYLALGSLLILAALMAARNAVKVQGQLFLLYLMLYAPVRSVVEIARRGYTARVLFDGLTEAQAASILIFIGALIGFFWRAKREAG